MAVVASATGVALGMTAGTIGAGLVGGAVLGAGIGGLYSAISGDGDVLNSMLTGGLIGFGVGGLGAAAGAAMGGAAGAGGAAAGGAGAAGAGGAAASSLSLTPTATALAGNTAALVPAASSAGGFGLSAGAVPTLTSGLGATGAAGAAGSGLTMGQVMGYGLAGSAAMSLLGNANTPKLSSQPQGQNPSYIRPYTYSANATNPYTTSQPPSPTPYNGLGSSAEKTYFNQNMAAQPIYKAAQGGLTPNVDFMGSNSYPMSQQTTPYYAVPRQMPTSAQQVAAGYEQKTNPLTGQPIAMAEGGEVQKMSSDAAVKAYNDAIMQKAIQTYVTPQSPSNTLPSSFNPLGQQQQQPMAPQGYVAPQAPANFDSTLLEQYRAANPNLRSYNAATQTYGAGIPNQAQYDAFKAQKDKEAADALSMAQMIPYSYGGDYGGGGAAGGLPRDFAYAGGGNVGHLGGYSDGGRMLKGPGDGMSDDIPASIGNKQPARLADGEFVVPADVVSHLGNGSTDAGAKRLYSMMDNVRKARTGTKKQGKQIKPGKFLPA